MVFLQNKIMKSLAYLIVLLSVFGSLPMEIMQWGRKQSALAMFFATCDNYN